MSNPIFTKMSERWIRTFRNLLQGKKTVHFRSFTYHPVRWGEFDEKMKLEVQRGKLMELPGSVSGIRGSYRGRSRGDTVTIAAERRSSQLLAGGRASGSSDAEVESPMLAPRTLDQKGYPPSPLPFSTLLTCKLHQFTYNFFEMHWKPLHLSATGIES